MSRQLNWSLWLQKLLESLGAIRAGRVARAALWLVAHFADSPARARAALQALQPLMPALPGQQPGEEVPSRPIRTELRRTNYSNDS